MARPPIATDRPLLSQYGRVLFKAGACWTFSFNPNSEGIELAQRFDPTFVPPKRPIVIAKGDTGADAIEIYPLNTTAETRGLFEPKYLTLTTIRFEGLSLPTDSDAEAAREALATLPAGFITTPEAGFGINADVHPIVDALEDLGVTQLTIKPGRRSGLPTFDRSIYVMARAQFEDLRKSIRRVHNKALANALKEKRRLAHNLILTTIDQEQFPQQPPIYTPDNITVVIATRPGDALSTKDQDTIIKTARSSARSVSKRNRQLLVDLSREIETVTLDELITTYRDLLGRDVNENAWQRFFVRNPFVLRLAFGYPVVQMGDQVSVGGGRFNNTGGKISDYAVKAMSTGNLALIEIKTPSTLLLEPKEYRGGVHAPHRELTGAVNQILDQIYQLQKNLPYLKENSEDYAVESFAGQGLVIAGRSPSDRAQRKSFELYRHSLRAILVITYDELLAKLESLAEFLKADPTTV